MLFKYFLVMALTAFIFYILLAPRLVVIRKVVILSIIGLMILFAIMPELSTQIANIFGIGRGADFLFYISHTVLFFMFFQYYLKFKDIESKLTKIIRHLAITEAERSGTKEASIFPGRIDTEQIE